jgi:hypothetical protein
MRMVDSADSISEKPPLLIDWAGKKIDKFLLVLFFIFLNSSLFIMFYLLKPYFIEWEFPFSKFMIELIGFAILMSTIVFIIYWGRIPEKITLDQSKNRLFVLSRRAKKERQFDLDYITYFYQDALLFSVLEINADFVNSRGKKLDLNVCTIVVLKYGLSWNKAKLRDIEFNFKSIDIPTKKVFGILSFWNYLVK